MRNSAARVLELHDGALVARGIDSPRYCAGNLRVVGVERIDASDLGELRAIASDLRSRGLERAKDGVLIPGLFDLVLHRSHYLALFAPPASESLAGA